MKAFKEWEDKRSGECCSCCMEAAWKAALEWVLDYCGGQTEDLRDDIAEELD